MTGAESGAGVAVEVLVEQQIIAPVRVFLELATLSKDRTAPILVALKQIDHSVGDLFRHHVGSDGLAVPLDSPFGPHGFAEFLQATDEDVGSWKPNRATPIGVAAFDFYVGFRRFVADFLVAEPEWMLFVVLR